jgi:hypothetical protein
LINTSETPPLLFWLVRAVVVPVGVVTMAVLALENWASVVRFADQTSLNLWSTIR